MSTTLFECRWLVVVMFFTEALLFLAPIRSQITEEHALAIAPSLQEIYLAINATMHDERVTWEFMSISDFSCRPGYFVGMRYGDPPLDEMFVPSDHSRPRFRSFRGFRLRSTADRLGRTMWWKVQIKASAVFVGP
jgi:hypothetical protein